MIYVKTGFPLVHRFDDIIEIEICNQICSYILDEKTFDKQINNSLLPWFNDDHIAARFIQNLELKETVKNYAFKLAEVVSLFYGQQCYPHFTDIVVWRDGQSMAFHLDDGYEQDEGRLACRKFTSVTYLNDTYDGGRTLVRDLQGNIYESIPKTGSVAIYTSDYRSEHSVTPVVNGPRVTMPIWFCTDVDYIEKW